MAEQPDHVGPKYAAFKLRRHNNQLFEPERARPTSSRAMVANGAAEHAERYGDQFAPTVPASIILQFIVDHAQCETPKELRRE